jgi:thiamine-monophosphate kinase
MEETLYDYLRKRLPPHPLLRMGLGDDAALLDASTTDSVVLTVDVITDQVDFLLAEVTPLQIGYKALAVNLSDMAAMAAEPVGCLVGLILPRDFSYDSILGLYEGMVPLAERFNTAIAGGDTNTWDGPLAISVTVLGRTTEYGPLRRGGGQAGDAVFTTGSLGGSILGRHLDFTPRVGEALELHSRFPLHAGMDISDGLSLDLARLARESGTGAEIDLARVPISEDAKRLSVLRNDGVSPLEHALSDGEDFELIITAPVAASDEIVAFGEELGTSISEIGRLTEEPGLWGVEKDGCREELTPQGWTHRLE